VLPMIAYPPPFSLNEKSQNLANLCGSLTP
jgi:hypothetical protein